MISAEGHIKVADFGIAKAYDQVATGDFMTSTGTTVGTPTYMAPEQAMGSNIGPWTDLYSAGVMAYELFVGQLPFPAAATPMAMLLHHINDPVPAPRELNPELDPDLERWILGLLDKHPESGRAARWRPGRRSRRSPSGCSGRAGGARRDCSSSRARRRPRSR